MISDFMIEAWQVALNAHCAEVGPRVPTHGTTLQVLRAVSDNLDITDETLFSPENKDRLLSFLDTQVGGTSVVKRNIVEGLKAIHEDSNVVDSIIANAKEVALRDALRVRRKPRKARAARKPTSQKPMVVKPRKLRSWLRPIKARGIIQLFIMQVI